MAKIAIPRSRNNSGNSSSTSSALSESRLEEIQKLAYQFFLDRGCEHGHDAEDWLRAEAIVKNKKT